MINFKTPVTPVVTGVFDVNSFMNKFMLLLVKRICLCLFLFGIAMPSKAATDRHEFIEKLASLPYGLGLFIAIFMFFVIFISRAYDSQDKEGKGYGRLVGLLIFVLLYALLIWIL